jgi:hypothetical protein
VPVGSAALERQQGNLPGTAPATKVVWSGTNGPARRAATLPTPSGEGVGTSEAGFGQQASTPQDSTAERTSLGPPGMHGKGAPTPGPVVIPMAPASWRQTFEGRSPREHRARDTWQHGSSATDSSADESLEVEQTAETSLREQVGRPREQRREGNDCGGPSHKAESRFRHDSTIRFAWPGKTVRSAAETLD